MLKEQLQALLELQIIDQRLRTIEKNSTRKEKAKEIIKVIKHKDELKEKNKILMENLAGLDDNLARFGQEIEKNTSQATALTEKLYGGVEKDPKELLSIQEKLAELNKVIETKENQYYDRLEERETLLKNVQSGKKEYGKIKAGLSETKTIYEEDTKLLLQESENLVNTRNKLEAFVDKDLLKRYNQKRGDNMVVSVINGNCGYCGIKIHFEQIRLLKKYETIERCESCGKVLFFQ